MLKKFSFLRPILAVLIIFIPLYPKFPLTSVTGTYVAIRLDDIIVAAAVFFLFLDQLIRGFPLLKLTISKALFAYYVAILLSFIFAVLVFQTDSISILALNTLRRFEYSSLIFFAIAAINSWQDFSFTYISMVFATVGVIVYGFGQKYLRFPVVSTMNSEFSKGQLLQMDVWTRISSTFAGHYDLAVYLSVVLVIIGGVIITSKNIWVKLTNIIVWLFSFYLLTLTASRVSIFAFYGGMMLTIFLLRRYLWVIPVTGVFLYSLLSSGDLNQRLLATIPALKNQFFGTTTTVSTTIASANPTPTIAIIASTTPGIKPPKPTPTVIHHGSTEEVIPIDADVGVARSGEIRFNVEWPRAITALRKSPVVGTGLGSITLATDNDYLRSLGESGILGFVTLGGIMFFFTLKTWPHLFVKKGQITDFIPIIFFGSMITFLANATLIDTFEASKPAYLFWIMLGLYYQSLVLKPKDKS